MPLPLSFASLEVETGDSSPIQEPMAVNDTKTAFLRMLSSTNKDQSTIIAYRADLAQFTRAA